MKTRQGFILIKFMIVVADIAILSAIPAYQSDTIRYDLKCQKPWFWQAMQNWR